PDLLRESTHLVLLAAELGLAVEPEAYAEATAWLSQLTELQPKDAGAAQLSAWFDARNGKSPPLGNRDALGLPGRWRIAWARSELPSPTDRQAALASLPTGLWWPEPLLNRLGGGGPK
ncbi:MAG: hypothetical protein KDI56_13710, partial [Xanthomonadales bacterium]|nr:hypothetical protein [Xanthomonadales bacterium]